MQEYFKKLGVTATASLPLDTPATLDQKIAAAHAAQASWAGLPRAKRIAMLKAYAATLLQHKETLGAIIHQDAGKTLKEAITEVEGAAAIIEKTTQDTSNEWADIGTIQRLRERTPAGVICVITSFNFPIAVAHWTLAPALLAGNALIWKPSEKTPWVALACVELFRQQLPEYAQLMQVAIGGGDIGQALVADERIDMISATGSVGMGKAIKRTLAQKQNNAVPPILELGGNNGVIISEKNTPELLDRAVTSLLNSFLGSAGQRCTNTRRLFVQEKVYAAVIRIFTEKLSALLEKDALFEPANAYGYGPLVDAAIRDRFLGALSEIVKQGGKIHFGKAAQGLAVQPAIAEIPTQIPQMHDEIFAPLLYVVPYRDFKDAVAMVNAPENAGLVNGIYTQDANEAEIFAQANQAGHTVINMPKGTGTPANGLGFGGNKASGEGEILGPDPERPFTRGVYRRIVQDSSVPMA